MLILLACLCFCSSSAFSLSNEEKELEGTLKRYIQSLQEEYKQHITELRNDFESRMKVQDDCIQALERDLSEKTKLVERLNSKLDTMGGPVSSFLESPIIDDGASTNVRTHSTTKRLLQSVNAIQPRNIIAFYANMSANLPAAQAVANHVLVFDVAKTNIANAYHPNTGIFIVPEDGVYVFTWNVFSIGQNRYHSVQLVVNHDEWGVIHLHTLNGEATDATATAVVQANAGDDVFVRLSPASSVGEITSNIYGKTFFAGWKL